MLKSSELYAAPPNHLRYHVCEVQQTQKQLENPFLPVHEDQADCKECKEAAVCDDDALQRSVKLYAVQHRRQQQPTCAHIASSLQAHVLLSA